MDGCSAGSAGRFSRAAPTFLLFFAALLAILSGSASAQTGTGEDNLPKYWEIHAFLLTAATVFFVGAYGSLWLKWLRKLDPLQLAIVKPLSRAWYRMHIYLAIVGTVLGAAGVIWGYFMVDWAHNGAHLRLPHAYVGLATGAILAIPMVVGFVTRASGKKKQAVRWWHVLLGFASVGLMLAGAISGWALE